MLVSTTARHLTPQGGAARERLQSRAADSRHFDAAGAGQMQRAECHVTPLRGLPLASGVGHCPLQSTWRRLVAAWETLGPLLQQGRHLRRCLLICIPVKGTSASASHRQRHTVICSPPLVSLPHDWAAARTRAAAARHSQRCRTATGGQRPPARRASAAPPPAMLGRPACDKHGKFAPRRRRRTQARYPHDGALTCAHSMRARARRQLLPRRRGHEVGL